MLALLQKLHGKKITIVVGHLQDQTFARRWRMPMSAAPRLREHDVKMFALSRMTFDPILRGGYRWEQPLEPDFARRLRAGSRPATHWVIVFPLWLGDMPAILKGFLERILQPDLILRRGTDGAMNWRIFKNKSARLIMTMGMPVMVYRFWYWPHALKLFRNNILHFIGVKPVHETLFGMVAEGLAREAGAVAERGRGRWARRERVAIQSSDHPSLSGSDDITRCCQSLQSLHSSSLRAITSSKERPSFWPSSKPSMKASASGGTSGNATKQPRTLPLQVRPRRQARVPQKRQRQ